VVLADGVDVTFVAWAVDDVCTLVSWISLKTFLAFTDEVVSTTSVFWTVEVVDADFVHECASCSGAETVTSGVVWALTEISHTVVRLGTVGVLVTVDVFHGATAWLEAVWHANIVWHVHAGWGVFLGLFVKCTTVFTGVTVGVFGTFTWLWHISVGRAEHLSCLGLDLWSTSLAVDAGAG